MSNEYCANLTAVGFLLFELKIAAKMRLKGNDLSDIKVLVKEDNLFQYSKHSSMIRILPTIIRRCGVLPNELLELLLSDTLKNAKLVNLLAIMEEDALFKDFMKEVVALSYKNNDLLFTRSKVNSFLSEKGEQSDKVASFSDGTRNKLRQIYMKILIESELLTNIKDGELNMIYLDEFIKDIFVKNGYDYFVYILEGK